MKVCGIDILDFGNSVQLRGAIFGEKDHDYLLYFPGEGGEGPRSLHEFQVSLEDWQTIFRQTDLVEVEVTGGDKNKKIILRKSQRNIDQNIAWAVYRRDGFKCRYCGADDVPMTVDHLVTWEAGGPTTVENMVCSCKKCNRTRSNTPYGEWIMKTEYYKKVSKNLSDSEKDANIALIGEIKNIPRVVHKRRRG